MQQKMIKLAMTCAVVVGMLGCGAQRPVPHSTAKTEIVLKKGGGFFDSPSACGFALPSKAYRIRVSHFRSDLPAEKIRHALRIYRVSGSEPDALARIELYDNPSALSPDAWASKHLAWLMGGRSTHEKKHLGKDSLPALIIHTPGSPQAYASETAVLSNGKRIAVVSGSNLNTEDRKKAFRKILETLYF